MERVALRNAFHGEPDTAQEGTQVEGVGPDQVTIAIRSGTLVLRVPNNVPDNQVLSKEYMDEFMQLVLELEDGSELDIVLDSARDMADTRFVPAAERGRVREG
ncbi:MAG: hypothetical protein HY741_11840 [Chloroflexi bacterium]|nr:hypothetical protein [Chloroflexota bacterium]